MAPSWLQSAGICARELCVCVCAIAYCVFVGCVIVNISQEHPLTHKHTYIQV